MALDAAGVLAHMVRDLRLPDPPAVLQGPISPQAELPTAFLTGGHQGTDVSRERSLPPL